MDFKIDFRNRPDLRKTFFEKDEEESALHSLIIKTVKELEQMPIYFEQEYYKKKSSIAEETLQNHHRNDYMKKMQTVDNAFDFILKNVIMKQVDKAENEQHLEVWMQRRRELRDMHTICNRRVDGWFRVGKKYIESLKNPTKLDIVFAKDAGELYHYEEGWSPWNKGEGVSRLLALVEEMEARAESKGGGQFNIKDNVKKIRGVEKDVEDKTR